MLLRVYVQLKNIYITVFTEQRLFNFIIII